MDLAFTQKISKKKKKPWFKRNMFLLFFVFSDGPCLLRNYQPVKALGTIKMRERQRQTEREYCVSLFPLDYIVMTSLSKNPMAAGVEF